MEYDIYFDESGDLGWTLDRPYRKGGGSSQYFTIAYLIIPPHKNKIINRFVNRFNAERGSDKEYKGADFIEKRAKVMANKIAQLLRMHHDITIGAVSVHKKNLPLQVIGTNNDDVVYNYLVQTGLCSKLEQLTQANIIPDKRSVPKGSQNSCADLIKNDLWFLRKSKVKINYNPQESHQNTRLIFIDWVANFVWRKYEFDKGRAYQILEPLLQEDRLFF
ncbi:MAG: hypothetical protein Sapg2KO_24570 [Saprospiraceae bacterium]